MSWDEEQVQTHQTPVKSLSNTSVQEGNYIQVPSSSPIHVKSSPASNVMMPPSKSAEIDAEKQQQLERKRQAIRNHPDFPVIRKKFYYLTESDIFKGFIKGKGNLRDINQWLTDNFDTANMVAAIHKQKEHAREQEEREREARRQAFEWKKAQEQHIHQEKEKTPSLEPEVKQDDYADEDTSPAKVGKARVKPTHRLGTLHTPTKGRPLALPTTEQAKFTSGKVQVGKPKVSILEKYKYKPKPVQPNIDSMFKRTNEDNEQPKRRRLVRASASEESSKEATPVSFKDIAAQFAHKEDDNSIDNLDAIEQKIKENRRKAKAKREVINISDLEDDDDDGSDRMSDEDIGDNFNGGLTSIDQQILDFLNDSLVQDISEIANIAPSVAEVLVSKRPFNSIYEVSEDNFANDEEKPRKGVRKTQGLRIVENTEFSLKGYRAVDSLVKQCSRYGELISEQMAKWGVTASGDGELEVVEIEDNEDIDDVVVSSKRGIKYIKEKPASLAPEIELKSYQIVGINWLNLIYRNNLSCILADEMGLGKTCQVISFMSMLRQDEVETAKGPHLVIVPSSTLENWLREFHKFCPDLVVQAYYGSQAEREDLRYELAETGIQYDVMVTTYNLATGAAPDFKFLKSQNFNIIVYDEGHMLKNSNSERYNKLMRLKARFRVLLTGTPLQNNLRELVSLLAFMLPSVFNEKREDLQGLFSQKASIKNNGKNGENYNPLLSQQAIAKAKTMMTPFVLRRKKNQVLKHLPAKTHEIKFCETTPRQRALYDKFLQQGKDSRMEMLKRRSLSAKEAEASRKDNNLSSSNVMMWLRKAAMHPLLFRDLFTDEKLKMMAKNIMREPEYVEANYQYILEDMQIMSDYELNNLCLKFPKSLSSFVLDDEEYLNSGKVNDMIEILQLIIERKEKVLVFSLFTQMLDILERVLTLCNMKFLRLDGQTTVDTRQDLIDRFYEDDTIPVFLLSTKAGGFGINLVAANNVVMFDQSFNPHDDKQAEDRAHRVGQQNEVKVTKLITKNTIEENMLQLAENKLQLDHSISAGDDVQIQEKAASLFEKALFES